MDRVYVSKYGAGSISDGNYLAEFICERIAKKEKTVLTYKFWQTDRWKKIYQRQIVAANQLLKEHSCKQILDALNHFRGRNIISLGLKKPIGDIIKNCLPKKIKGLAANQIIIDDAVSTSDWEEWNEHIENITTNIADVTKKKSAWEIL